MAGTRRAAAILSAFLLSAACLAPVGQAQEVNAPQPAGETAPVDSAPAAPPPHAETELEPSAPGVPDLPDPSGEPPTLTAIGFDHPGAHCRFLGEGVSEPAAVDDQDPERQLTTYKTVHADPATLFFTERRFDGFGTFERGYARINGLLRELVLVSREKRPDGERRRYETLEAVPVSLDLEFSVTERTKVLTLLEGKLGVRRGERTGPPVAVAGLCGPDAANRAVE